MTAPLLEVRDLSVRFPVRGALPWITPAEVRAVDRVSLTLRSGETLGVVGESGCGKTTLGAAILGLQLPTEGEILFDGRPLRPGAPPEARDGMQVIFQDPYASLNPRRRVWKSVGEPMLVRGTNREETRARVAEIFAATGLQRGHLDRLPHQFSGGQRQRLAIARALVRRPRLIVCDEPVSALDVSVQSQILNLLNELQQEFRLAYIFVSHDLAVVKNVSDRIAVMYLGKVVESAPAERLFEAPAHPYTRALLDAVPRIGSGFKPEHPALAGGRTTESDGAICGLPVPVPLCARRRTLCTHAAACRGISVGGRRRAVIEPAKRPESGEREGTTRCRLNRRISSLLRTRAQPLRAFPDGRRQLSFEPGRKEHARPVAPSPVDPRIGKVRRGCGPGLPFDRGPRAGSAGGLAPELRWRIVSSDDRHYIVLAQKPIRVILINELSSGSDGEVCAVVTRSSVGRSLSLV